MSDMVISSMIMIYFKEIATLHYVTLAKTLNLKCKVQLLTSSRGERHERRGDPMIRVTQFMRLPRSITLRSQRRLLYDIVMQQSAVYFMTNKSNKVLYIGVTSNLIKRVYQHKTKAYKGFTEKYNCDKLVYFEVFSDINEAISREKQLKKGNRKRKNELVNSMNSLWKDLSEGWIFNF